VFQRRTAGASGRHKEAAIQRGDFLPAIDPTGSGRRRRIPSFNYTTARFSVNRKSQGLENHEELNPLGYSSQQKRSPVSEKSHRCGVPGAKK
jgi:hypothetical protein